MASLNLLSELRAQLKRQREDLDKRFGLATPTKTDAATELDNPREGQGARERQANQLSQNSTPTRSTPAGGRLDFVRAMTAGTVAHAPLADSRGNAASTPRKAMSQTPHAHDVAADSLYDYSLGLHIFTLGPGHAIKVTGVLESSPCKGVIHPDDSIESIDDKQVFSVTTLREACRGAPGSTLTIKYRTSDPAAASARSKFATVMKNLEGDFPFSNFFMQKLLLRRALTPEGRPYLLKDSDGNQNGNYEAVLCGHDDQVTLTISPSKEGAVASTAGRSTQRQKPSIHTPRGLGKNVQSVSAQDGGDALASTTQSFSLGIKVEDTYGVVCLIDSSAFEGKMEKGDFIRKANGKRIRTIEELKAACAGVPGTWFVLQVKRRSSSNPTNVVLQRCILPNGRAVAKMNAKPAQIQQTLGIEVMDKFGLVTISKISRGGPCEGHLQVLDVVSTIDGKSVLAQESLIRGAQGDVGTTFTLVCSRRGEVYTHVLERTINDDGSGRLVVRSRAVELLDDEAARAEQAMIQAEKVEAENLRQFNQRVQVSDADAASGGSDQLPTRATMPLLADPSDPGRQHVELSSTSLPSTLSDVGELESRKQDRSNNASVVGALQVGQVSSTEPQARNDLPSQISLSTPSSTPHLSATSPPAVSPLLAGQEPASGEPPSMNHEKQQQKHIQISLGISVAYSDETGLLTVAVVKTGSTFTGWLEIGDVILGVDGREVSSAQDLRDACIGVPGSLKNVFFKRGQKNRKLTFRLPEADPTPKPRASFQTSPPRALEFPNPGAQAREILGLAEQDPSRGRYNTGSGDRGRGFVDTTRSSIHANAGSAASQSGATIWSPTGNFSARGASAVQGYPRTALNSLQVGRTHVGNNGNALPSRPASGAPYSATFKPLTQPQGMGSKQTPRLLVPQQLQQQRQFVAQGTRRA